MAIVDKALPRSYRYVLVLGRTASGLECTKYYSWFIHYSVIKTNFYKENISNIIIGMKEEE
jgi:hypothetical protein